MANFQDAKQKKQFGDMREKEAESLARILSERYQLPYIDLSKINIDNSAVRLIPEETARKAKVVVYAVDKHMASVAAQTPHNDGVTSILEELTRKGYTTQISLASEFGIARAWETYNEVSLAKAETKGIMSVSDETMQRYVSIIKTIAQ